MPVPVLTDEQAAQLAAEYRAGKTLKQLAAEYYLSKEAVRRTILRAGGSLRRRGWHNRTRTDPGALKPVPHHEMEQTIALYRSGLTIHQVADQLGIGDGAVIWRLGQAGEPRRPTGPAPRVTDEQTALILQQRQAGMLIREIAAEHGVSQDVVRRAIARAKRSADKQDAAAGEVDP